MGFSFCGWWRTLSRGINILFGAAPITLQASVGRIYSVGTDATIPAFLLPPPTGLSAQGISNSSIDLSWTAVNGPNLKDYGVYRNGINIGFTTNNVSFTDTGLAPSTSYTYNVTARSIFLVESALSAPATGATQSGGAGTTLVHNQAFIINGSDFGTKTNPAPMVYDNPSLGTVGTINPVWNSAPGNNPSTAGGSANIQIQSTGFNPSSFFAVPGPDPFQTNVYAGCHLNLNTNTGGNNVQLSVTYTPSTMSPARTTPYPIYATAKYRYDPNYAVDPSNDQNIKPMMYSMDVAPQPNDNNFFYHAFGANNQFLTNPIRAISRTNPCVITIAAAQATHPVQAGQTVGVYGLTGTTQLNGVKLPPSALGGSNNNWTVTLPVDATSFGAYPGILTVTGISVSSPGSGGVVTVSGTGLATNPFSIGCSINFENVVGMTKISTPSVSINCPSISTPITVTAVGGSQATGWTATMSLDTSGFNPYTSGGSCFIGMCCGFLDNNTVTANYVNDGFAQGMWQATDAITGKNSSFVGGAALYPLHAANGWITQEWTMGVSTVVGTSTTPGPGYMRYRDQYKLIQNYTGKTENISSNPARCFSFGDYGRDRGPFNFVYFGGPLIFDVGENNQVEVPRVLVGNAPTFSACTVWEYAPASAWSDGQITATFYRGNYNLGDVVYVYVVNGATGIPATPVFSATVAAH